jgi:tRNA dimethylallyltransferase
VALRVLCLGGPTATGKTAAAIEVARRWSVELVSADAMQVYRGMDVGTAKPPPAVLAEFPHHAIDIRDPHESYSAADFASDTDAVIALGRPVVVVGGTGFYFRALLHGLVAAPPADPALRAELEQKEDLHAELAKVDPVLAARLHPNDRVRLIRGLEVYRLSGQTLSSLHASDTNAPRHASVRVLLDRDDVAQRIDGRVLEMMSQGYLAEVQGLLDQGVSPDAKPMRSLGYRWLTAHLTQGLSLDEAVRLTQRDTRRFARKQRGMFRSVGGFETIAGGDLDAVLRAAERAFGPS